MATELRTTSAKPYDADFYVWALEQAELLRRGRFEALDLHNLIEEVEGLADTKLSVVLNSARVVMEHLLKLQYSPASDPRNGWRASVREHRRRIEIDLTPRIAQILIDDLPRLYRMARDDAQAGMRDHGEHDAADALPETSPYGLDQVTGEWWRESCNSAPRGRNAEGSSQREPRAAPARDRVGCEPGHSHCRSNVRRLAVGLAGLPTPPWRAKARGQGRASMQHTIQSGETLSRIAAAHGTTLERLLEANPRYRTDPDRIRVGEVVEIPNGAGPGLAEAAPAFAPPPTRWILGTLSSKYETGGRGPGTVSTGIGDAGGVSYGSYQMTSRPRGGTAARFVADPDSRGGRASPA